MSRLPVIDSPRPLAQFTVISEHQIIALAEQLEHKIELLMGVCDEAKQRIGQLERENHSLQESLREQQARVKELEKKQLKPEKNAPKSKDFAKLVQNNLSSTDTNAELKQQLDEYIRDLERCIAHLSSLS